MSDSREIWFVRRRYIFQNYPVTWQGWLATLLFAILVIAVVILAAVVASAIFAIAAVVFVFAVAFGFLRFIFGHSATWREYRDNRDA